MKERTTELKEITFVQKKIWKVFGIMDSIILIILLAAVFILHTFYTETIRICFLIMLLVIILTLLLNFALVDFLFMLFRKEFKELSSVKLVNERLSTRERKEVVPKHSIHKNTFFFTGLTNIAKFYAIIDDVSNVNIYVKFNNEKELRFLEQLSKKVFSTYYEIK